MGRVQRKRVYEKNKLKKIRPIEKTRKQLRKEKRQQKKINRAAYYQKQRSKNGDVLFNQKKKKEETFDTSNQALKTNDTMTKNYKKVDVEQMQIQQKRKKEDKAEKRMKKRKTKQLKLDNLEEDKIIKHLEKQLKLNKRKSKSISKSFVSDGLDYLLDFCDSENRNYLAETEKQLLQTGLNVEFKEDLNMVISDNEDEDEKQNEEKSMIDDRNNSQKNMIQNRIDDSKQNEEDENILFDENLDQDDEILEEETSDLNLKLDNEETENKEESHNDVSEKSNNNDGLWEDIYGRQRDKQGNVVSDRYVPPAARVVNTDVSLDNERTHRLQRQLKGILNKLAEQNMYTIAKEVEEIYMSNSRNDVNVLLSKLMMESIITSISTPDRLICEHMMLITILHANVGTEVGAHFLLTFVKKLDQLMEGSHCVENKQLDNIILMISHLYNFKIYGHRLLYQILEKLAAKFTEKEIELILLILKTVGFQLRKDDPVALKEFIINLQQKANTATQENSRVKFMLNVLLAIKNNNVSKIPHYDSSWIEHLKKILKNFIHKGNIVTQFNITLEDLLEADERGKWWVVGSAWSGLGNKLEKTSKVTKQKYSEEIMELAHKQRMNTDIRRDIFCVLMTAEDYLDAFEKIHQLGLKTQQQREVVYVILSCCIQEKKFNLYYAILAQKLCDSDRKYQLSIQFALWDKLKTLNDLNTVQLTNLIKLLIHLFLNKGLPLSVLKIIHFTELDKLTMRLVRQIMLGILLHKNEEACFEVFSRISFSPKLQTFRESLRLFINHFLIKNISTVENLQEQSKLLKTRAEHVDKILSTRDSKSVF